MKPQSKEIQRLKAMTIGSLIKRYKGLVKLFLIKIGIEALSASAFALYRSSPVSFRFLIARL